MTTGRSWLLILAQLLLLSQVDGAFYSRHLTSIKLGEVGRSNKGTIFSSLQMMSLGQSELGEPIEKTYNRREALSLGLPLIFPIGAVTLTGDPKTAVAKDELFKPNPLTNPILEQIRIWEQAEADELKYGGELAPGSPKGRETYAKLLLPILSIERDLDLIDELVHKENGEGLPQAATILDKPKFQKIGFKKIFNAFADNIYYSDPDRANMYLGGGATPKNEQSIAYLLRNDILTNVEDLQAEVAYLIKEQKNGAETLETDDLYQYIKNSKEGMVKYLELVPPGELKMGRELFSASKP